MLLSLPLFGVSVFALGLPLAAFFANLLIFGWSIGLIVSALVLRLGLGAESLAWVAIFALAPLSGVYYPIHAAGLVAADRLGAAAGLGVRRHAGRTVRGRCPPRHCCHGAGLNLLYMAGAAGFFLWTCEIARDARPVRPTRRMSGIAARQPPAALDQTRSARGSGPRSSAR